MKINWKEVAASRGYILMKAAVADDLNRKYTNGDRFQKAFNFAINRAKHYIYYSRHHDYTQDLINQLDIWERWRKQSFLSFYSTSNLPKPVVKVLKPIGVRGVYKLFSTAFWKDFPNKRVVRVRAMQATLNPRTKKARWTNKRKKEAAYWREKSL